MAERIKQAELPAHGIPETAPFVEHGPHLDTEKIKSLKNALVNARLEPGMDQFTITPEMRARYGGQPNDTPVWKQNPRIPAWGNNPGNLHLDSWLQVTGGRVAQQKNEKGQMESVLSGDLMLCWQPAELEAAHQEILKDEQGEYLHNIREGDYGPAPRWRDRDTRELTEMAREEHQNNVATGLLGQWSGQDYRNVMHNLGAEKCRRIMDRHRGGQAEEAMSERRAQEKDANRGAGGKFVSIPDNVRPRNFQGAKK